MQPNEEMPLKNPYGLAVGAPCYQILIAYTPAGLNQTKAHHQPYRAAIAVPVGEAGYHPDPIEGAASLAFLWAKEHDGLQAGMMAFCAFYYYDAEEGDWLYCEWAEDGGDAAE